MKNLKKFLANNKFTVIALICFVLLLIVILQVKAIFFPNLGKAIYGDRLDNITSSNEVTKGDLSDVKDKLKENESVEKVSTIISGKIVNIIVTVKDELELDGAKALGNVVLENFDDKQKKAYDIQLFIQKPKESNQFPIIGYKQHTKDGFTWTKDRG